MRHSILFLLVLTSFLSCEVFIGYKGTDPNPHGTGIVSWKDFLYVLGGRDAAGTFRPEVWFAKIGQNGLPVEWKRTADLPAARAESSAVVDGVFLYVIGGQSADGFHDDVLFALMDSKEDSPTYGEPRGFTSVWETNPRKLPFALEASAVTLQDGRIVLAGGLTGSGPVDSVLYARIWNDGSVGQWYRSAGALPGARSGAGAAISGGRMWVVSGRGAGGLLDEAVSAGLTDGLPGAWRGEAAPGYTSEYPALVGSADGLLLFGGWDGSHAVARGEVYGEGVGWQGMSGDVGPAYGPSTATVGGRVYFVRGINGTAAPDVGFYVLSASVSDAPLVTPGSGWVSTGMKPKVIAAPNVTVRSTTGTPSVPPGEPNSSSTIWPTTPAAVTKDTVLRIRGFQSGMAGSPEVVRTYRVRPGGMFPLVSGTVALTAGLDAFRGYTLEEKYSNGLTAPVTSVWLKVSAGTRGIYTLRWADAADHGASDAYTAVVRMSLFEEDTFASVYERTGAEVAGRTGGYTGPVQVELAPGDYYLLAESADGRSGGSFGISLTRE